VIHRDRALPTRALLVLIPAVAIVSTAAVLIRLAGDTPPLAIAFWRNVIAASVLGPVLVFRGRSLTRAQGGSAVVAGLFLALHFGFWISSLRLTSVTASVVLVCTQPIFVAVLGRVFLGEVPSSRAYSGIALALVGAAVVATTGLRPGSTDPFHLVGSSLAGNALALLGAVAVAAYVLVGRSVQRRGAPVLPYVSAVYLASALALGLACLVSGTPLGLSPRSWLIVLALALGPHLVGHTLVNWALGHLPAVVVSGAILAEPVLATLLASIVLGETPELFAALGGALTLLGVAAVLSSSPVQGGSPGGDPTGEPGRRSGPG
jgi:drug/metabolite transporter (DMT)-like permease